MPPFYAKKYREVPYQSTLPTPSPGSKQLLLAGPNFVHKHVIHITADTELVLVSVKNKLQFVL